MGTSRHAAAAAALPGNRVLVAGGKGKDSNVLGERG